MTAALIIDFERLQAPSDELASAIAAAGAAGLSPIIVVGAAVDSGDAVWTLEDESNGDNPLSALQAALDLLDRERSADSVVVIDAAHGPTPDHIAALIDLGSDSSVVATKYRYARALPAYLGWQVWQAVMALDETPLFSWIDSHPSAVGEVWVASAPSNVRTL
ncbi:MAG: NTP transferase domain-containing protein [Acidimicrobiia bacterium]|nr:NTP transferase domain-containing protein [Acidimicrobiia bacterium]